MVPQYNGTIDIGAAGTRFNNLYATTLYGNLIGGLTSVSTFTVSGATTLNSTLTVNGNAIINSSYVPSANTSPGVAGQVAWDSGHVYICIATNTWRRANIAIW
jgi:hypothetical protein